MCLCNGEARRSVDQYTVHLTPCTDLDHNYPPPIAPSAPKSNWVTLSLEGSEVAVSISERCTLLCGTILISCTTDYELDDQSLPLHNHVQIGCGALPVSCVMHAGLYLSERETDCEVLNLMSWTFNILLYVVLELVLAPLPDCEHLLPFLL